MAEINDVTCGMTRDERCAADVAYMASMGSFGEDFLMYGCAYLEHGKVTYRISPEASQLYLISGEMCPSAAISNHGDKFYPSYCGARWYAGAGGASDQITVSAAIAGTVSALLF